MTWLQTSVQLPPLGRGFHLITQQVVAAVPELAQVGVGLLHVFLQHTSASLAISENADPDVGADLETAMNRLVPDGAPYFVHTVEGPDDMAAHVKAALLGSSLSIPIRDGRLALGTWQGIFLCEHRDRRHPRSLIVTVWGEGR